ncbi:hypothetical protein DENIS_1521 [Desulfonema ishimotonii]|uniref:4-aminobutyrate aminotransferase n=1 Tax=Desulfonema ishimotonii TaxID=45657 RepID=A0A401FUD7_9BACT|nr:DUF5682 family protein [Desulfonema ishimotonii]GBC60564.1 hypothetical protein DENIS_1521 [Desulfonema ishimotonii]
MARLDAVPASSALRLIPIRHHSPACAEHIQTLIRRDKPEIILIEGPSDAGDLIPFLARSAPPVAIYAYFVDRKGRWAEPVLSGESARYRCFYPFADFSPEWAAIRAGTKARARIRFIDLPYRAMLAAGQGRKEDLTGHDTSMLSDRHMAEADVTRRLVEKSRCRDFNEWWDRAFESGGRDRDADAFFRELLAFVMLLRDPAAPSDSETEGREQFMAARIREALGESDRVMVITGGYHTEALARHLSQPADSPSPEPPEGEGGVYLVPYSLHRLDTANGYAAGIPDCGYYQRLRAVTEKGHENPHRTVAEQLAVEIGGELRRRGESVSFSESLEAVVLSQRLGQLRGVCPGRSEILDAMETAFVRGELAEAGGMRQIIREMITPDKTGKLPKGLPVAPIVEDFRHTCAAFRLPLQWGDPKARYLDIYRSERHRQISRFFHQLAFLEVPYATHRAGPDFAAGSDLNRVREIWEVQWQSETEAFLTEQMRYGGMLRDAALSLLTERLESETGGPGAVALLISALMMGLHPILERILQPIADWLVKEGDFVRLITGLRGLYVAHTARNVLETEAIPRFPFLLEQGFQRACAGLTWIGETDEERLSEVSRGMADLNGFGLRGEPWADDALFIRSITPLCEATAPPVIRGTASGILISRKIWGREEAKAALRHVCDQAWHDAEALGGFLAGFLLVARGALIRNPDLAGEMSKTLGAWDEEIFINALPALRLAFTHLTPRETRELARTIGGLTGRKENFLNRPLEWSPDDLRIMARLREQVDASLVPWGIGEIPEDSDEK